MSTDVQTKDLIISTQVYMDDTSWLACSQTDLEQMLMDFMI